MPTALPPNLKSKTLPHPLLITESFSEEELTEFLVHIMGEEHRAKILSSNHPDVHIYHPEEKSGRYPITTIRAFINEMALPPFEAKRKVFFLFDAEKMLPTSSNALLKTLEEPSEDSFVVLFSENPNALLPTIASRLHQISSPPSLAASEDVAPLFAMAKNQQWPELLDTIAEFDDSRADPFFKGALEWAVKQKKTPLFGRISSLVAEGQTALAHNVKLRTVLLNFFLELDGEL